MANYDLPSRIMFCPSCGTEHSLELRYCHRCGANLSALIQPEITPVSLTKSVLIIGITLTCLTLGGFGALIGGATALAEVVHGNDPLMAMIFFGMMVILTIDIFLLRLLTKLINAALKSESSKADPSKRQSPLLRHNCRARTWRNSLQLRA